MSRLVLLAVALAVAHAQATAGLALGSSSVGLAVFAQSSIPLRVAAGPDGSTVVGANETSAQSSVAGGVVTAAVHNTATVTNRLDAAQRVRLTLLHASGTGLAECVECTIQLRNGATHSAQLSYVNGAASSTQGPWVTFSASGSWTLHTVTKASVVADKAAEFTYQLEMVPSGSASPSLVLYNMRVTFTV